MEIRLTGTPKEIADLIFALQNWGDVIETTKLDGSTVYNHIQKASNRSDEFVPETADGKSVRDSSVSQT